RVAMLCSTADVPSQEPRTAALSVHFSGSRLVLPISMTKRAGHLWLVLASSIVALFLCEAILQIRYRTHHGNWLWKGNAFLVGYTQPVSDRRQYSLRPNWTDPAQGIAINRLGFRGKLVESATPVIVVVGDSIPFGAGVKDDETYPAQL